MQGKGSPDQYSGKKEKVNACLRKKRFGFKMGKNQRLDLGREGRARLIVLSWLLDNASWVRSQRGKKVKDFLKTHCLRGGADE